MTVPVQTCGRQKLLPCLAVFVHCGLSICASQNLASLVRLLAFLGNSPFLGMCCFLIWHLTMCP